MADDGYNNVPKAVLQPRHPGEGIKKAEVVLKRRDRNLKAAAERAAKIAQVKRNKKAWERGGGEKLIRAETLVRNAMAKRFDKIRHKIISKQPKKQVRQLPPMVMASRNGRLGGCQDAKKVLRALGLTRRHSWVFLKADSETIKELWKAKPYVFWGRPSFKNVDLLIHKQAKFKSPDAPNEKTILSDNNLIEQHLGDLGVICTEDLAFSIHKADKNFAEVNKRLWPMYLGDVQKAKGMVRDTKFREGPQSNKDFNELIGTLLGN